MWYGREHGGKYLWLGWKREVFDWLHFCAEHHGKATQENALEAEASQGLSSSS